MDLIPNGNCNAGKGDFILLPESVALQKEPLYGKTDDEFAKRLDSKVNRAAAAPLFAGAALVFLCLVCFGLFTLVKRYEAESSVREQAVEAAQRPSGGKRFVSLPASVFLVFGLIVMFPG